jgi:hypothetical protein
MTVDYDVQELLKKCSECDNRKDIERLEQMIGEHGGRLLEGENRFSRSEAELKANSRLTQQTHEAVKSINEMMYVDKPDQKCLQSTLVKIQLGLENNNSKVGDIRAIIAFIVLSLAGLTFFLIQKNIEVPNNKPKHQIVVPYPREKMTLEELIKRSKEGK